jgi:predicted Fe-Mo cluster-binding NifX family protein
VVSPYDRPMIIGVTTTPHGTVGGGLGRAQTVAVADVRDGAVSSWTEVAVGWSDLHGIGPEGTHHARIVRFVREHAVECVVTSGLGEGMRTTMGKLGVVVRTDLTGDARTAAVAAATTEAPTP